MAPAEGPKRKVILHMMTTLDGCVSGPAGELDWLFAFRNDDRGRYLLDFYRSVDAILVGRVTYDSMASFWPGAEKSKAGSDQDREFAKVMNSQKKYVFSKTLDKARWANSEAVRGGLTDEVAMLRAQPGKDMVLSGGVSIAKSFMELGLVDEYRLIVHPVVLGVGRRLFEGLGTKLSLKLVDSKRFDDGVVAMRYARA